MAGGFLGFTAGAVGSLTVLGIAGPAAPGLVGQSLAVTGAMTVAGATAGAGHQYYVCGQEAAHYAEYLMCSFCTPDDPMCSEGDSESGCLECSSKESQFEGSTCYWNVDSEDDDMPTIGDENTDCTNYEINYSGVDADSDGFCD